MKFTAKQTPCLVHWGELGETAKNWDRKLVRAMPRILHSMGYGLVKRKP